MAARRQPVTGGNGSARTAPASSAEPGSRFDAVLGERRGIADAAVRTHLAATQRELEVSQQEAAELRERHESLERAVGDLHDRLEDADAEIRARCDEVRACECEVDRVRYALVRATGSDIGGGDAAPDVHHGVWTRGRPYLFGQHVYWPEGGACYRTPISGIAPGHPPGVSRLWLRCVDDGACPKPVVPGSSPHPVASGLAVRQTRAWWDRHGAEWALSELTDEHLRGVITWLHDHADELWGSELAFALVFPPCPAQAYLTESDWLADLPLVHALEREVSRRRSVADAEAWESVAAWTAAASAEATQATRTSPTPKEP